MQFFIKTYRLIALILALLMFTTSIGFSVDLHYCKDQLKSISIFGKAKQCSDLSVKKQTCLSQDKAEKGKNHISFERKKCCRNQSVHCQFNQLQGNQKQSVFLNQSIQQFIIAFVDVTILKNKQFKQVASAINVYHPPLIHRDIPILFESFLL